MLQHSIPNCTTYKVFILLGILFSAASFFGVVAVTVDRFLAIHLHLRYQELITHKRVLAVTISIWVLSPLISLISLWVLPVTRVLFLGIPDIGCFLLTVVVYIRIYLVVRRHNNEIQALQVKQADEMTNFADIVKTAVGVFYVYLVFLFCYVPYFITLAAITIVGPSDVLKRLFFFSSTLAFLNSSLNPVIYCWKMRHIRHVVMEILPNIINWLRNP